MQNPFHNPFFSTMKRVCQKSNAHCGPAVIEMLFSFVGVYFDQDEFVNVIQKSEEELKVYGITVAEMAKSVKALAPEYNFWFKENSSLSDLQQVVEEYGFPVGVEWQGVFYEDADEDDGHYSVVTHVDTVNNIIMLSDPYKRFAGSDRSFHIMEFDHRWWDENEIVDELANRKYVTREEHMMFLITPKETIFPETFGMIR
ncbi:C39 family peptidase [Patescibacteria group bacterium]|nr:C39 family peptidase [Patescibacteria group bacterium]MBU2035932.1 C39 family peptidase [Patescibacteria group bacterium]